MKLDRYALFAFSVLLLTVSVKAQDLKPVDTGEEPATAEELVLLQAGDLPIIISAPHGGNRSVVAVENKREGVGLEHKPGGFVTARDTRTTEIAQALVKELERRYGKKPYLVASLAHRRYLDPNRPIDLALEDPDAKPVYERYHGHLQQYHDEVLQKFHTGLVLDIHGQGSRSEIVFRGTQNGQTVKSLRERHGEAAHTGEQSLMGLLAKRGWQVHPAPHDGKEQAGFTGGYIVQTYGSSKAGTVDAIQLEFGGDYRKPEQVEQTAITLADAVIEYAELYLNQPKPAIGPAATPAKPNTTLNSSDKLSVGVYVGAGTSSKQFLFDALAKDTAIEVKQFSADDIRSGKLSGVDVLIHPGGSGSKQGNALEATGREQVREFVMNGGGYVGICAGAYLATSDYDWSLNILDAKVVDRQHWARGFGNVQIELSDAGKALFASSQDAVSIYYHQGPLLAPGNQEQIADYCPLATFKTEIAKNGAPPGIMLGTTAIATGEHGKGRVICFSPHPEKTPGVSQYVIDAVYWAARKK